MSVTEVMRGLGDRPGDDISDPLLTHETARLARGRYALDSSQGGVVQVDGSGYYIGLLEPGALVQLSGRGGKLRRGILDECEVVFDRVGLDSFTADTNVILEVEDAG